jgi:hypothetical protein
MSPVGNTTTSRVNNPAEAVRVAEPRARSGLAGPQATASQPESVSRSNSAIVQINPAARERAQAEGSTGIGSPANRSRPQGGGDASQAAAVDRQTNGQPPADTASRLPVNVGAALRAYEANRAVGQGAPSTLQRGAVEQADNRASASRDDPADDGAQARPARASSSETRDLDQVARERQQRDAEANLRGGANQALRLGNQSAGAVTG